MAAAPQFYCAVVGQTDGGGNERLGAGACHRSRCRLRHGVSAVGAETPSTEKAARARSPRVRVAPQTLMRAPGPRPIRVRAGFSCVGQRFNEQI
jgi:hypothetical protein